MSGGAIITNSSVMSVGPRRIGALPLDHGQPQRVRGVSDAGRRIQPVRTRVPGTQEAAVRAPSSPPIFSFLHMVQPLFPVRCLRAVVRGRSHEFPLDTALACTCRWPSNPRQESKKEDSQSAKQHNFTRCPRKAEQSSTPSDRNKREQNCLFPVQPFHDMAAEYVAGDVAGDDCSIDHYRIAKRLNN